MSARVWGAICEGMCRLLTAVTCGVLLGILGVIVVQGIGIISVEFLTGTPTEGMTHGGIWPAIFGTVCITLLMVLMALPLGVAAAIYLVEYAGKGLGPRIIRAAVNNLAGVPSIVFGLFGLGFFILFVGRSIDRVLADGTAVRPAGDAVGGRDPRHPGAAGRHRLDGRSAQRRARQPP